MNEYQKNVLLAPLMIVGSPRSGTTWLQKMMLESPSICGGQESYFYSLFYPAFKSVADREDARRVGLSTYWTIDAFNEQMQQVWINTFKNSLEAKPQASLLLDKTPFHALYLDEINRFLPNAKFIHIIRDSRAVTASLIAAAKSWGHYWAPKDAKKAALEWYRHVKYAREAKIAQNSQYYLEVHYEDLMVEPLVVLKNIMVFAGINVEKDELERIIIKHQFDKAKKTNCSVPLHQEISYIEPQGFFRKGQIDTWKSDISLYQKIIVWRYTRKMMQQCGYNWNGRVNR